MADEKQKPKKKINSVNFKGRVTQWAQRKEGKTKKGGVWRLYDVALADVPQAGRDKVEGEKDVYEEGVIGFSTFKKPKGAGVGAIVGVNCRVTGETKEWNDDGVEKSYVRNYLSANKVEVIEAAPEKAPEEKKEKANEADFLDDDEGEW